MWETRIARLVSLLVLPPATSIGAAADSVQDHDPFPALEVLASIPVENEHGAGYNRDRFLEGLDEDGDGCRTRSEVLIRDSLAAPTVSSGCHVVAGEWLSVYDRVIVTDPGALQVDHVVALDEAWNSGAWAWDDARRAAFANDIDDARTLRAVTGESNQAKGNADPSNWIPPNEDFVCEYLADWIAIKARWSLTVDQSEAGRIRNLLSERCPQQNLAPWPEAPSLATPPYPPLPPSTMLSAQDPACDAAYPTVCIPPPPPDLECRDITYRRFTALPSDPHHFDGDGNGIGCEAG